MPQDLYIEDIFIDFFDRITSLSDKINLQDYSVMNDFYSKIVSGQNLTENQAKFLLKLLSKNSSIATSIGLDYTDQLKSPKWKKSFRVIDQSKRVFVEKDELGLTRICLQFPYSLKDKFDKEVAKESSHHNKWDHDRKLRVLDFYYHNPVLIMEFVKKYSFKMDDSFLDAFSQVEEIWQQQEEIIPFVEVIDNNVFLKNCDPDVENFWNSNQSKILEKDLFLAKSMALEIRLNRQPENILEKIVTSPHTNFWIKKYEDFINLHLTIGKKTCILIDRNTEDVLKWLEDFVKVTDGAGIDRSKIKVCFRESNTDSNKFNEWIKSQGLGGSVAEGEILIFRHKPAKWLFKEDTDVKIIATNSFTPIIEPVTAAWMSSHPCVCYIGDIRPTKIKEKNIVEL